MKKLKKVRQGGISTCGPIGPRVECKRCFTLFYHFPAGPCAFELFQRLFLNEGLRARISKTASKRTQNRFGIYVSYLRLRTLEHSAKIITQHALVFRDASLLKLLELKGKRLASFMIKRSRIEHAQKRGNKCCAICHTGKDGIFL
jgi:hypothetical protein